MNNSMRKNHMRRTIRGIQQKLLKARDAELIVLTRIDLCWFFYLLKHTCCAVLLDLLDLLILMKSLFDSYLRV